MKTFEILAKDRKILVALFFMPILAALGLGFIFSKVYVENIPFGIADLDNSSLSQTMIRQFRAHPGLKITYYTDSKTDLEAAVKARRVWGGLVIPQQFAHDVLKSKAPKALVLINGTNIVIGNNALAYCSAILGTLSAGLQINVLEGRGLLPYLSQQSLTTFSFVERVLYDPTLSYLNYLICMLLVYILQTNYLTQFMVPWLLKEKSRLARTRIISREGRDWLKELALHLGAAIIVLGISSYIALLICGKCYGIPARGNFFVHFALVGAFLLALTAVAFVFAAIFENLAYFLEFYTAFGTITLLTGGVVWPEYMMPKAFLIMVKSIWPIFHVLYPIKALHLKALGWDIVFSSLKHTLLYALFWGTIGIYWYFRKIHKKALQLESDSID